MSAPPASVMRPTCHGPEKIIGCVPLTKAGRDVEAFAGLLARGEALLEEGVVEREGLDRLGAVEGELAGLVHDVAAVRPQERHVLLVVLGAEADAPLGAALLLHRLWRSP